MMKSSIYNFFIQDSGKLLCFNSLSRKYFRLASHKEDIVKKIILNPDKYLDESSSFYNTLKRGNFIINSNDNELEIIKDRYAKQIESKDYKLVILPTLECNFGCWYCIQRHVKGKIDNDILNRIYKHIEYMIVQEKIDALSIEWFGGEPFKYFGNIIKPISIFAKQICEKYNIPFRSQATTNGYLITSEIATELESLNFDLFQITLDGDREYHNKTRVSKQSSSFDTILKNINNLCSIIDDLKIYLRINYDDKNLNPDKIISEVNDLILLENRNKIVFTLKKVWQVPHFKDENKKLKKASFLINKNKFKEDVGLNLLNIPCYASKKYYNAISFNGNIYKCTAREKMHADSLGYLTENGQIQWYRSDFETKYYTALFDNEDCLKCKSLPICMGPCSKGLEVNKLNIPKHNCNRKSNDQRFENSILKYCSEG